MNWVYKGGRILEMVLGAGGRTHDLEFPTQFVTFCLLNSKYVTQNKGLISSRVNGRGELVLYNIENNERLLGSVPNDLGSYRHERR